MQDDKPLAGIKVIDFSAYAAAPGAARILADQGAEVIKVEPATGDPFRSTGALLTIPVKDGYNPAFDIENANKQLISIDVRIGKGKEIFYRLLANADVLVTNYREDALARMEVRYEDLKEQFPRLVYGSVTGYGNSGPEAGDPGYDIVAYFARSGFMLDTVTSESDPVINVGAAGDHPTAVALAQGVTAALVKQQRTGKGEKVSVSLYHMAIWTLGTLITSTQFNAKYPTPYNEPPLSPVIHPYKCSDGEWILPMILDFKKYFVPLCESLGLSELASNEDYNSPLKAKRNQSQLVPIIANKMQTKTAEEWSKEWKKMDIPHDVLRHFKHVLSDEQAIVNDFVRKVDYPDGKQVYLPTPPIQFTEAGNAEYKITGRIGADTVTVLKGLGYSEEIISELAKDGVVKI
ncbi:MAG TPA: CaiB/BaiF CoA-transferase family protein [Negativicutes bacterium]